MSDTPNTPQNDSATNGVSADASSLQPVIDANQAGASEGYGEGAIQILEGLEAVRKRPGKIGRAHV